MPAAEGGSALRRSRAERGFSMALGLFAMVLAAYLFLQSPFFRLEKVRVIGAGALSEADVAAVAGLGFGQNLFDINLREAERRLEAEPKVKRARVRRHLPAALVVWLEERKPVAAIVAGGTLWALDDEARVLGEVTGADSPSVVALAEPLPSLIPGSYLEGPEIRAAVAVAAELPGELARRVCEISAASSAELELLTRDGVRAKLGQWRDIARKLQVLASLLHQAEARGALPVLVDVSHPEKPVVR